VEQDTTQTAPGRAPRALPLVTLSVLIITSIGIVQLIFPAVLGALRRDPRALAAGDWWRLGSPLLVNSDGVAGYLYVAVGIVLVGALIERLFGRALAGPLLRRRRDW